MAGLVPRKHLGRMGFGYTVNELYPMYCSDDVGGRFEGLENQDLVVLTTDVYRVSRRLASSDLTINS